MKRFVEALIVAVLIFGGANSASAFHFDLGELDSAGWTTFPIFCINRAGVDTLADSASIYVYKSTFAGADSLRKDEELDLTPAWGTITAVNRGTSNSQPRYNIELEVHKMICIDQMGNGSGPDDTMFTGLYTGVVWMYAVGASNTPTATTFTFRPVNRSTGRGMQGVIVQYWAPYNTVPPVAVAAATSGGYPKVDVTKYLTGTPVTFPSNFADLAITSSTGRVTVGTNADKTGYSLTQSFPSNFSSLAITAGGAVTVGTNSDKTGYSLSQTFPTNFSSLTITSNGGVYLDSNTTHTGKSALVNVEDLVDLVWNEDTVGHYTSPHFGHAAVQTGGWTTAEKNQIRFRLGVDGDRAAPSDANGAPRLSGIACQITTATNSSDISSTGLASYPTNAFNNQAVLILTGTMKGQVRVIQTFTTTTGRMQLSSALTGTPSTNDSALVLFATSSTPAGASDITTINGSATAAANLAKILGGTRDTSVELSLKRLYIASPSNGSAVEAPALYISQHDGGSAAVKFWVDTAASGSRGLDIETQCANSGGNGSAVSVKAQGGGTDAFYFNNQWNGKGFAISKKIFEWATYSGSPAWTMSGSPDPQETFFSGDAADGYADAGWDITGTYNMGTGEVVCTLLVLNQYGAGVQHARVFVYNSDTTNLLYSNPNNGTGSTGRAIFSLDKSTTYRVRYQAEFNVPDSAWVTVATTTATNLSDTLPMTTIPIPAPGAVDECTIYGYVKTPSNDPVPKALVILSPVQGTLGSTVGGIVVPQPKKATTDANGMYSFSVTKSKDLRIATGTGRDTTFTYQIEVWYPSMTSGNSVVKSARQFTIPDSTTHWLDPVLIRR